MQAAPFRILLFNLGYYTEIRGRLSDYFLHWYRYLHEPKKVLGHALRSLHDLLRHVRPNVCCFVEVHKDAPLLRRMHDYPYFDVDNKYGKNSVLRHLPFFRSFCNGFFARTPVTFQKIFFRHGLKKLVYEIRLPDGTCLIMAHFSLSKRMRRLQLLELQEIVCRHEKVIVCGDFNIFKGTGELADLVKSCGLVFASNLAVPTFPSFHPRSTLDLFLCSPAVKIKSIQVMQRVRMSDHLPVLLEVELQHNAS